MGAMLNITQLLSFSTSSSISAGKQENTEAEKADPTRGQISPQAHPQKGGGWDSLCEGVKTQKRNHAHMAGA